MMHVQCGPEPISGDRLRDVVGPPERAHKRQVCRQRAGLVALDGTYV
jgi:hypothetical protein